MSHDSRSPGSIYSELDAAFATVQRASLRHEAGYGDAQKLAREFVTATVASINRRLLQSALSPAETRLIKAKVNALIGAAARIPGPSAAAHEHQSAKAAPGR
jgi:hypothetical protein